MQLFENERIDYVNDSLSLIQRTDGLTFGTDALLLAAYVSSKYDSAVELGAGTGIISMLLLTRGKVKNCVAVEVQEDFARLTERNAELNNLQDRMTTVTLDIREYLPKREFDLVYTNPPYMKADSGKANISKSKNIARHEICGNIFDFAKEGARLLKYGADFYAVYRPDRMIDLICACRESSLEPKRMTLVYANTSSKPSMLLLQAKKGGKCGLLFTKPLIIYRDSEHKHYTDDMNYIMENGSFPDPFLK